jgi:hypothetical protein
MRQLPALVAELRRVGLLKANEGKLKPVNYTGTGAIKIPNPVDGVNMTNGPLLGRPQSSSDNSEEGGQHDSPGTNTAASGKSPHFQGSGITVTHETKPVRSPPSLQSPENATQNSIPTPQTTQVLG